MLRKFSVRVFSFLLAFTLITSLAGLCNYNTLLLSNKSVYAENDNNGNDNKDTTTTTTVTPPKSTADPKQILTDPSFDLNTVDPAVLKAWYESEVNIPDAALKKALQDATGLSTVTVQSMLGLSGTVNLTNMGITTLIGMEYAINIKKVLLSNNTVVSLDPLKNLSHLEYLDYSNNSVKMVPSWVFTLPNLTTVNGSNNGSTSMQQPSTASSALVELYLENNAIVSLPDISCCSQLTSLSLANNTIATFPTTILSLPKLSTLFLSGNKLTEVPNLSSLGNLTVLNLDKNFLTKFPEGIENMTSLQQLSLTANAITSIPDTIANAPSLSILIIYGNDLTTLPEALTSSKLTVLDIGLNDIDLSANEAMIKSLTDKLQSFYYKLQKPNFELQLVEDKAAPGGKLVWNGVEDMKVDNEGYYTVSKIIVERKAETITDEDTKNNSSDSKDSGNDNEDVVNKDTKPVISVFEKIAELDAKTSEYIDESADSKTDYTYKVTVYINGKYMDNYQFETSGFKTVNTKDMIKQSHTKLIIIIVGGVVLLALIVFGVMFFLKKKKNGGNTSPKKAKKVKSKNVNNKMPKGKEKKNSKNHSEENDEAPISEDLSSEEPIDSIEDIKRILEERQKKAEMKQSDIPEPKEELPQKEIKEVRKPKKRKSIISDWEDDDDIENELNKILYSDDEE